jgi:hypothetical protein
MLLRRAPHDFAGAPIAITNPQLLAVPWSLSITHEGEWQPFKRRNWYQYPGLAQSDDK